MSAAEVRLLVSSGDWPGQFRSVADVLHRLWGDRVRIEHIGSTSVPGLIAKPIIDVLAGSDSLALFDESRSSNWRRSASSGAPSMTTNFRSGATSCDSPAAMRCG